MPKTLSDLYITNSPTHQLTKLTNSPTHQLTNVAHEFYHRHRRALLTVARFSGLPLSVVNARLCWG
jgi:hypothetical protein